ncbi:MAG: hypothetical protein IPJ11_07130 [Gemmatimonadetes bacterium]|nr:hypothetical protein [Gemmatimonadota bacterium]
MSAPVLRPLSAGEVLDVSFGVYRAHFVPLVTIAAITRVLPDSLGIYVERSGGLLANVPLGLTHLLLSFVLSTIGIAATTSVVSEAYLGGTVRAVDAIRDAFGFIGRLLVSSIGSAMLIVTGLVLLIIPGIIAMSGLMLSSVVVVLEDKPGIDALQRSWDLSKGFRRKILAVIGITSLLLVVPTIMIGAILAIRAGSTEPGILMMVATSILSIFVYPFVYVATVVLYYDIRVRKEGFDLELMASDVPAT